ncbi:MAG: cytochrome c3 family protein [Pseudomonadota bacterium]
MRQLLSGAVVLIFLGTGLWVLAGGQEQARRERPMLPVTFAHTDHRTVNCVTCHHDYIDDSGKGLCFDCHKTDPAVNALVETHFHGLCRSCHLTLQAHGEDGGPTRRCIDCHTADEAP